MPFDKPISSHTERHPVKLTPAEFASRATRIAQLHGDLGEHIRRTKSEASTAAARKKELEAVIAQLAEAMRNGEETRDVLVNIIIDNGEALEIRDDTEEVLRRRALRPDEKQAKMFGDDVKGYATPEEALEAVEELAEQSNAEEPKEEGTDEPAT
jgi:hypothetical protein